MNIDPTFLMNKINQLCERVAILEKKIQYYEGNNLQNNNLQNNNFLNNNFLNNNTLQNNFSQNNTLHEIVINKKEEENKIYDPLSIDYTVKKNDNTNKQKNILFTNNNNNNTKRVVEVQDKIYDPLTN